MLFVKNFKDMSTEEREGQHTHKGRVEVTSRVFEEIVGYKFSSLTEKRLLQRVIDETSLTGNNAIIFQIEYGRDIAEFPKLPDGMKAYLCGSSFEQLKTDLKTVCKSIRENYEVQLAKTVV